MEMASFMRIFSNKVKVQDTSTLSFLRFLLFSSIGILLTNHKITLNNFTIKKGSIEMYKSRFGQLSIFQSPEIQKISYLKEQYSKAILLSRRTQFDTKQILSLFLMHQKLLGDSPSISIGSNSGGFGKMDRLRFREILHTTFDITDDIMLDRIFRAFDTNNDSIIDDVEWICGLSILLKGTLKEQITFCYFIYDINGDRSLAREELFHCLKNCLVKVSSIDEELDECIKDVVELAMRKLDVDKNGQITFDDFERAVIEDPFLLESIGPCLPSQKIINAFLENLQIDFPIPNGLWKGLVAQQSKENPPNYQQHESSPSTLTNLKERRMSLKSISRRNSIGGGASIV